MPKKRSNAAVYDLIVFPWDKRHHQLVYALASIALERHHEESVLPFAEQTQPQHTQLFGLPTALHHVVVHFVLEGKIEYAVFYFALVLDLRERQLALAEQAHRRSLQLEATYGSLRNNDVLLSTSPYTQDLVEPYS